MNTNKPLNKNNELRHELMIEIRTMLNTLDHKNRYLSKKDTCKYLDISNNTLDKWIELGLPVIRINGVMRFDRLAIDNWLTERV